MLFCNSGIIIMFLSHSVLSYDGYNILLICIPTLFIALFWMMPESPVFYLKMERLEDCRKSLSWLKATTSEDHLNAEVDKLRKMFFSQESGNRSLTWREVFATQYYRKAFILGIVLLSSICSSGITTIETYFYSILSHCMNGQYPGNYPTYVLLFSSASMVISVFIIDRFTRRFTAIATRLCCTALLVTIGILLFLRDVCSYSIPFIIFFVLFFTYFIFFNLGFSNVVFVVIGELFSVECRDKFMQPLMLLHFFLHGFYLMLYPITVLAIQIYSWIFIHAFVTLALTGCLVIYLPETRNKTIAEIAQKLTSAEDFSKSINGNNTVP